MTLNARQHAALMRMLEILPGSPQVRESSFRKEPDAIRLAIHDGDVRGYLVITTDGSVREAMFRC